MDASTSSVPARPTSGNILDEADVLTPAQEEALNKELDQYQQEYAPIKIAVLIYKEDRGRSLDYATRVGNEWGVGKDSNDGVMVTIDTATQNSAVAVSDGAGKYVNDDEAQEIVDQKLQPNIKQGKYSEALDQSFAALKSDTKTTNLSAEYKRTNDMMGVIVMSCVGLVAVFLAWRIGCILYDKAYKDRVAPGTFDAALNEIRTYESTHGETIPRDTCESYLNYRLAHRFTERKGADTYRAAVEAAEAGSNQKYTHYVTSFEEWYPLYQKRPSLYMGTLILPYELDKKFYPGGTRFAPRPAGGGGDGGSTFVGGDSGGGGFSGGGAGSD